MGEGESNNKGDEPKVEAISLDDWQPKPVSLGDWVVEEKKPAAKSEPVPAAAPEPQAISLDDWQPKPVSLDEWTPSESAAAADAEPVEEVSVEAVEEAPPEIELEPSEAPEEGAIALGEEDLAPEPSLEVEQEAPITLGEEDLAPEEPVVEEDQGIFLGDEGLSLETEGEEEISLEEDGLSLDTEDEGEGEIQLDEEESVSLGDSESLEESLELGSEVPEDIDTTSIELRTQTEQVEVEPPPIEAQPVDDLEPEISNFEMDEAMIPSMAMPGVPMGAPIGEEVADDEPLTDAEEIVADETEAITLGEADLAENHLPPVLRLRDGDLRENSQLAVIRLGEKDLASEHRVVFELEPTFFEEHGIAVNANGVILLDVADLAHPEEEEVEEEKPSRSRRRTREVKESYWTNERISKFSIYAIVFCLFAIPTVYHFKYTWTTVTDERYEEIKADTGGVDWVMKTMFKYRTSDSSFRWFGRRLLNADAYQRAEQEKSMLWLRYVNSGQAGLGDSNLD